MIFSSVTRWGKVRPRTQEGLTEQLPIASHQPATLWKAEMPVMASVTVSLCKFFFIKLIAIQQFYVL